MSLLISIQNSVPLLIISFGLIVVAGILFIRLRRLNNGITALIQLLEKSPTASRSDLPDTVATNPALTQLAVKALDSVTEAEMASSLFDTRLRIQTVLLDQVKDGLLVVDESLQIRFANHATKTIFDTEIVDRQLIEVTMDHRFSKTVESALQLSEGSLQEYIETDNGARIFSIESGPVTDAYEVDKGAWLIVRDITLQVQTENLRKDFVANASHELRTPLSIIKGYLEILEDDQQNTHAINIMSKHTDRLTKIVEDMLLISRIESTDGSELQKSSLFDIADCINDTVDHLQPMIDTQQAKIKIQLPDKGDRQFYGDRFYWDQIFFNLIENALKQNPAPDLKIKIIVTKDTNLNQFAIQVIDNGIGIPSGDLEEVFKRFYRVDKSHSQKIKGTGLGLSIVTRAVEAHDGTISVTSQPYKKTSFNISVPAPPI